MNTEALHIPVMPVEVMELLDVSAGQTAVDGTLGLGGHAVLMAQRLGTTGHLIGIDRDSTTLAQAKKGLASFGLRIDLLQGSFNDIDQLLAQVKVQAVDGILLDLGISSFQLNNAERGFAFIQDGPLDMRMDQTSGNSAADLVNRLSEEELARIIGDWGEDRFARRIAKAIVFRRAQYRIERTGQLAEIVLKALPHGYIRGRIHPATRTFQALRIAVNAELEHLQSGLQKCLAALKPGGRMAVLAFHSLEDRIVKNSFRTWVQEGQAQALTKKPLRPSETECEHNPRSRSARLRGIKTPVASATGAADICKRSGII